MQLTKIQITAVYESPSPEHVWANSPAILQRSSGRLIASFDLSGPGIARTENLFRSKQSDVASTGVVVISDDHGLSWRVTGHFPFMHGVLFAAGDRIWLMGNAPNLVLISSVDEGESWSHPHELTRKQRWHGAPNPVLYENGRIWIARERYRFFSHYGWNVAGLEPVVLSALLGADLANPRSWSFTGGVTLGEALGSASLDGFGLPFYSTPPNGPAEVAPGRFCSPMGWLEANLVQLPNSHVWKATREFQLHLFLRVNTGGTGFAGVLKLIQHTNGRSVIDFQRAPSGVKTVLVPFPCGHQKFCIIRDENTGLYWLTGNQSTDSFIPADAVPSGRYNLPNNERHRLQLLFSRNCVDWCFAGLLAVGYSEAASFHYPQTIISGDDLLVICRAGDGTAKNAQYSNSIKLIRVQDFRRLIY